MIDAEGQPFHDPRPTPRCSTALRDGVGDNVELIEMDNNVNDPEFADAMADKLDEYMKAHDRRRGTREAARDARRRRRDHRRGRRHRACRPSAPRPAAPT